MQRLCVLEAGCGWNEELDLGSVECSVIGVDDDLPELRARTRTRRDLDAWHLGDLRTVPMPPRVYDVVHASHLIERIPHAELVLDRFVAALKPGGLMLMRFRDRHTAFGYLDRRLPQWLRRLLWHAEQPPPAVYERVASAEGMRWYSMMRGLVISEEYTSRDTMTGFGALMSVLFRAVSALSHNRLPSAYSEVTMVIRKPENRFARIL
ncbi:MAG: Methyltransferase type 12 [Actinoallomurus sp.]|nr:Methyltransferase type 12 [Actinoallomurus sp.]